MRTLIDIVVIHHPDAIAEATPFCQSIQRAFQFVAPNAEISEYAEIPDPWQRVSVTICNEADSLGDFLSQSAKSRTLFIVFLCDSIATDAEFIPLLDIVAESMQVSSGRVKDRDAQIYTLSATAIGKLSTKLKRLQAKDTASLGEHHMAPHIVALVALHRARQLLSAETPLLPLKLFISHAKADGIFLAVAVKALIESVEEFDSWYDAQDLLSGQDWESELKAAASRCVFIAIRTDAYDQRKVCREEFEIALSNGVPILVVDATYSLHLPPTSLPYACMPTVRVPDGNTNRIVIAAIREHVRLKLMEAIAKEVDATTNTANTLVWPRFPNSSLIMAATERKQCWLVPQSISPLSEFIAMQKFLQSNKSELQLEFLESFQRPSNENSFTLEPGIGPSV
jgi:hypothetical protein